MLAEVVTKSSVPEITQKASALLVVDRAPLVQAAQHLTGYVGKKAVAANAAGQRAISGWTKVEGYIQRTDEVFTKCQQIGHELPVHIVKDQGRAGRFYACHAEKQMSTLSSTPIVVVGPKMCRDCIRYFQKLAVFEQTERVVQDFEMIRVFKPDGSVIKIPN
jgi:hypothetical protein